MERNNKLDSDITRVKGILREVVNNTNNQFTASTTTDSIELTSLPLNLEHAQTEAYNDEERQATHYNNMVIFFSGFSTNAVCLHVDFALQTLNSMASVTLLTLPAEIRTAIYELALPQGRIITTNASGRSVVGKLGKDESHWLGAKVVPGLLQVNKSSRAEATPVYYSNQAFVLQHQTFLSNESLESAFKKSFSPWYRDLKAGFPYVTKFGLHIDGGNVHLQLRIVGNEYSIEAKRNHRYISKNEAKEEVKAIMAWVGELRARRGLKWPESPQSNTLRSFRSTMPAELDMEMES